MADQNSYAEFILGAFRAQLVDCARWYPELAKEFTRDYLRLSSAINGHGIRFALDVMPSFRKHLDKCLAERRLTHSHLLHFGVLGKGVVIPRLFRGLTMRVFDGNGLLKDQPDVEAIRWLRQLLGAFRKLRLTSEIKDRGNAIRDFYRVDMGVRRGCLNWDDHIIFEQEVETNATSFVDVADVPVLAVGDLFEGPTPVADPGLRRLLGTCQRVADILSSRLGSFDPKDWSFKHGPGAVADQAFGSYKYNFLRWPDRLESVFTTSDFAIANYGVEDPESIEELRARGYFHDHPARLCAVPKTIKTPRLIACEPVSLQWCQQAIRDFFYSRVRSSVLSNFVDFRRQDKNGSLALEASHDQRHSTIDLSSASDRISCWHVERLFRRSPALLCALQASRSVWLTQDICRYSPKYHYLRKYSTMGNATTFPVQSLFFLTLALACVFHTRGQAPTIQRLKDLGDREVRVFGDDIIVPTDASGVLVRLLEALSLKVNASKTFMEGNFRESCGVDAFSGNDVTSVSILEKPRRASPSSVVSTVDAHNNLLSAGYFATSAFLRKTASLAGFAKIREVKHGDGAFGWYVLGIPSRDGFSHRVNKDIQTLEIKCLQPKAVITRSPAEGSPGLLQFFTEAAKKVTSASSTLGSLDRRPQGRLALRWATF
uniref:RNA-directed RNA polymerase n=1 Tax=Leviviridae sp. TaxID=2027243 RepID=A0A514D361_9VIRU|nr:MAG: RNA-dependent RNA polymerase [Leviviridae sp.]